MKKTTLLIVVLLFTVSFYGQVGINTTNPNATLDVEATNVASPSNEDGMLIPRIDDFPSSNPGAAQDGMMVFVTGNGTPSKGFYYWDNGTTTWVSVNGAGGGTLDEAYDQGGAGLGRTIIADNGAVLIGGDDGLQNTGTFGSGATLALSGGGTKMFFYPRKAAFRAGNVTATQWNDTNIGDYSVAMGRSTTASGIYDVAIGFGSIASGTYSTALGWANTASGAYSMSLGQDSDATGWSSTALGRSSSATGSQSMVFGHNTNVSGTQAIGIGNFLESPSGYEIALGNYNTTYTPNSTAGIDASDRLLSVGNGTSPAARSNALTIYKSGLININDAYNLPLTDGTAGQVMTTDGSGNVSFTTVSSTDDQTIDTFSFNSGTNLVSLEIEDDGIGVQTVDLSSLDDEDADWLTTVGSNVPTSNNDDIYTLGNVSVGSSINIANFNISHNEASDGTIDYLQYNTVSNSGNDDKTIIYNSFGSAQAGNNTAMYNLMIGNGSGTYRGVHNYSYASVTGDIFGVYNVFSANGNGAHYGSRTSLSGIGSGLKYGTYNYISPTAGGTHYGIYADVQNAGGYAGYFLGRTSLGTSTTNRYLMPAADGTAGQVMTTNGSGQLSFTTIATDTDWTVAGNDQYAANTGNVGIGDTTPDYKLDLEYAGNLDRAFNIDYQNTAGSGIAQGLNVTAQSNSTGFVWGANVELINTNSSSESIGIRATNTSGATNKFGIAASAIGTGTQNIGISGRATTATTNYGGYFTADFGGTTNYGIVAIAENGSGTNWAGYFGDSSAGSGNVFVNDNLRVDGQLAIDPTGTGYTFPTSDGTSGQVLTTDGAGQLSFSSGAGDADWYQLLSTSAPNSINDNIYTEGKVTIGSSILSSGLLNAYSTDQIYSIYSDNSYSPTAHTYAGYFTNSGTGSNNRYALLAISSGGGNGDRYGGQFSVNSSSTGSHYAISNTVNGSNGDFVYGVRNNILATGGATQYQYGTRNTLSTTSSGRLYGVYNDITSSGSGSHYGTENRLIGTGNGNKYGSYNFISSTGSGNKYGFYSLIGTSSGGTHYGIYSDVQNSSGYAGYFIGRTSLGDGTTNRYIMPGTDGTSGQVIQTDGSGNLSWTNATGELTTASNGLTEVGDDIQLGGTLTQNTTITNGNFDIEIISSGTATDALTITKTDNSASNNTALDINKTTNGSGSGTGVLLLMSGTGNANLFGYEATITNTGSGSKFAFNNSFTGIGTGTKYGLRNQFLGSGSGTQYGVHNTFGTSSPSTKYGLFNSFSSSSGNYYGVHNNMSGATNSAVFGLNNTLSGTGTGAKTGVSNSFTGANGNSNIYLGTDNTFNDTGNGNRWGTRNNMDGSGTGIHYGTFNDLTGTGSGTKYGSYNYIDSGAGGTHYGVYSEVDNSNGYAGYFLGQNYISLGLGINNPNPDGRLDIIHNSTGFASPHVMLTAQNANSGTRITFDNAVETNNYWVMFARADDTSGSGTFNIYSSEVATNVMRLESDGKMGIMRNPTTNTLEVEGQASKTTAGAFVANSDRRLKKNIEPITGETALSKIEKMRGVTYLWNDDKTGSKRPEGLQYGFIAQELMEVFPEKVTKDNLGYYQTAYGDYDPIFVEAIKELKTKNEKLQEKVKSLESQLSKYEEIEARLSALENKNSESNSDEFISEKKK